ncbi:MAG TPA: flagellar hook-associated protein FlgK, partial [Thermotogota bacterium]|nr:flagellar hook-associated protein FlgK [Thermotogota bacterium]
MASYSIFSILNTGVLGTYTSKMAMSVTGHNVANANTDGYSRQRPDIVATPPSATGAFGGSTLNIGTGSTVSRVERIRDEFLDRQFREISKNYAYWDEKTQNLHYMEQILSEPSENGMRSYFDGLWNSFLEVMNQPTNSAAVSSVTASANSFITTAQDLYAQYEDLRANLNQNIKDSADNINLKLQQIADLNGSIRTTYILKTEPNDLLDKRDVILDELSALTGMTYKTGMNGHLEVFIGNQSVLYGDIWTPIKAVIRPGTQNMYDYFIRSQKIDVPGGTVGAMFQMRDVSIPNYLDQMDEMALMMSDKMNLVHRTGYDGLGTVTGIDFFKELEAVRSELPNLFRTMGTHAILDGPIHMISASVQTDPSITNLALSGKISLVDLNNKNQLYAEDSEIFSTNSSFQDLIDYLNQTNLYTTRAYNLPAVYDLGMKPEDFPTYTGKAEVFYKAAETVFTATSGVFHVGEIEDIDHNGAIDGSDIEIKDQNGNRLTDFTYDFVDKTITINEPFAYTGTVSIRKWESYIGQYRDGELVVPPNEVLNKTLSGATTLFLDDFVGYTDDAKIFYATQNSASFTAINGIFTLNDLVDMDRNNAYDRNDLRIQVQSGTTWTDVADFSYDETTGRVTLLDEAQKSYSGALRLQYWQNKTIPATAAGTLDLSGLSRTPAHFGDFEGGTLTENDFHVFLSSESSWEAHTFDDGTNDLTLTDFADFSGDARTFFAISASATATAGAFTLSDALIDINRDGKFDASDIMIQVDTTGSGDWADIQEFSYDSSSDTITIQDQNYAAFSGDVRLRRWQSQGLTYASGVTTVDVATLGAIHYTHFSDPSTTLTSEDFKVIAPRERRNDDYQIYLETMRADTMRTTSNDYKLLFGKVSEGLDEYGRVDSAKANSYGDMREMLVFDQNGLLSRLGYQTVSKDFLKISETLLAQPVLTWGFTLDETVAPGEFSLRINATGERYESSAVITWESLADDFKNDDVLKQYFTVKTTENEDGTLSHKVELNERLSGPESVSILKGADVLDFQIVDVNPTEIPSEDIVWYFDVLDIAEPDALSYSATFAFPALASPSSPTPVQPIELNFTDRADLLDQIQNHPILSQYLTIEEKNGRYRLLPSESIIQLQNLEGLQSIEPTLRKILSDGSEVKIRSSKLLEANLDVEYESKSLTLTVPVFDPVAGMTKNTPYTLVFRNRDELIEKINNNAVLNQYVKAFELDGAYYLTHTPEMESLSTLVTRDEYNVLSSKTLKVIDTGAYKTLANIMYDYSYAMKKDYAFSGYASATVTASATIDLKLGQNLLEYEGKIEVQYAIKAGGTTGFTTTPVGSVYKVNYGLLDIRDINEDGI